VCCGISYFLNRFMESKTRDNIIYLLVGLGIAGLLAGDAFYAQAHDREMWMPSTLALRLAFSTPLIGYFVARETWKVKATFVQVIACVLFASIVHLAIWFGLRQTLGQLSGIAFSAWAILEIFLLVQLLVWVVQHLRPAGD